MRYWESAVSVKTCGYCGATIAEGDAVQVIQTPGIQRPRLRCKEHAEGEVDWQAVWASKKAYEPSTPTDRGFTRASKSSPAFDPKMAAANDR